MNKNGLASFNICFGLFLIISVNVLIFFVNDFIYPKIKTPSNIIVNSGTVHDGKDGVDGLDGTHTSFALDGANGEDAKQGIKGRYGKNGATGKNGNPGNVGETGLTGFDGVVGQKGLPSNSRVPIINKYSLNNTDSYSMIDSFSFEDTEYQVSMYANIENNSRFVLKFGEDLLVPLQNLISSGPYDFSEAEPEPEPEPDPDLEEIQGSHFYSELRIAIGYGRGNSDSLSRSDDVVFYVSPPISRLTYLFRYKTLPEVQPGFEYLDGKFVINPVNNTKDFYFFDSKVGEYIAQVQDFSVWKYHLMSGLAKYELVVNTFPPLPGNYKFNFRIIETFTRELGVDFTLPKAVLAFNTSVLSFKQSDETKIAVSNRFDLNRVISRDHTFDKIPWIQTSKQSVETIAPEPINVINYDNTYESLNKDFETSFNIFDSTVLYWGNGLASVAQLKQDKLLLTLNGKMIYKDADPSNVSLFTGMRNYIPRVPLDKFRNSEKFYLKMSFDLFYNDNGSQKLSEEEKYIFEYGREFSYDLLDFQLVYSKSIFLQGSYIPNAGTLVVPIIEFLPGEGVHGNYLAKPSIDKPIEVGYTKYPSKERYTTEIILQTERREFFYFNIPLYGYKKQ